MSYETELLKSFTRYTHNYSLVQADGDSGDSAQRIGSFFVLTAMANIKLGTIPFFCPLEYEKSMQQHEAAPGIYRRSNKPAHWGYNPNNLSRDQWSILQLAFAANGDKVRLKQSMRALLSRGLLHQNVHPGTDAPPEYRKFPDIAAPTHFSVFIRGMNWWFLYPLLLFFDLFFIGDLIARKYNDTAQDYDNMLAQQLLYAYSKYKTPISWLVMQKYKKTDWLYRLDKYHSKERNGILCFPALFWLAYDRRLK